VKLERAVLVQVRRCSPEIELGAVLAKEEAEHVGLDGSLRLRCVEEWTPVQGRNAGKGHAEDT
jgi:hypothetical protein